MADLCLYIIPREVKDDPEWTRYVSRSKPLRLQSLQQDPKSFISKYDSEVKEPIDFWIKRLKDPQAWTVVMVRSAKNQVPSDNDVLLRDDVEWVGFCVMIAPEHMTASSNMDVSVDSAAHVEVKETDSNDWHMAAVWLRPEVRGQGAGERLIEYGVNVARKGQVQSAAKGSAVTTQVVKGNERALNLYKSIGFQLVDEDSVIEKEGVKYSSYELRLPL